MLRDREYSLCAAVTAERESVVNRYRGRRYVALERVIFFLPGVNLEISTSKSFDIFYIAR